MTSAMCGEQLLALLRQLYAIYDRIHAKYPDLIIQQAACGGGATTSVRRPGSTSSI